MARYEIETRSVETMASFTTSATTAHDEIRLSRDGRPVSDWQAATPHRRSSLAEYQREMEAADATGTIAPLVSGILRSAVPADLDAAATLRSLAAAVDPAPASGAFCASVDGLSRYFSVSASGTIQIEGAEATCPRCRADLHRTARYQAGLLLCGECARAFFAESVSRGEA